MYVKTDKELLDGFAESGKRGDFEELFKRYHPVLWHKSLRMFKCREDAEDLLQDFWLYIFNNISRVKTDEKGSAARFIHTVYTCDVYDFHKKRKWDTVSLDNTLLEKLQDQSVVACNPVEEYLYMDELQKLRMHIISTLPEKDRILYQLYDKVNLSVPEIAQRYSLSEGTIRNRISSITTTINNRLRAIYATVSVVVGFVLNFIL